MPVHLLAGNHDDRALVRETFGLAGSGDEPIQYAVQCGDLRLVACDTTIPGRDGGRIDVEWIAAALEADTQTPTILALHHPPVAIGIPADRRHHRRRSRARTRWPTCWAAARRCAASSPVTCTAPR